MQLPPHLSHDDILQEMEILKLQGITNPSKRIVYLKLTSGKGAFSMAELPDTAASPWVIHSVTPPEVVEELIEWTFEQTQSVQDLIWDFLDNPEETYDDTVKTLQDLGFIKRIQQPKSSGSSISHIILNALPATKEELIELVQAVSPETERPAATVRQNIRRLTKTGKIKITNDILERI